MTVSDSVSVKTLNENTANDADAVQFNNIWSKILQDVQDSTKATPPKLLILLGDNESGRTTIISRLKGVENIRKGIGLEYHYIDIKDEDRDDVPKLSVWVPDGDGASTNLLKFALNEQNFEHTMVAFVVSMNTPWSIMDSLEKWSAILTDHIKKLNISSVKKEEYIKKQYRTFQFYQDPDEKELALQASMGGKKSSGKSKTVDINTNNTDIDDNTLLPLDPLILSKNLGLPVMVIVTKCDSISILDKEMEYRIEHFDFIQYHIRRFCLQYGASLFYTTVKDKRTFERLYKYLLYKLYCYPFAYACNVVDRESIFIPTGWDNEGKMNILLENSATIKSDSEYSEIIARPTIRKAMPREVETVLASEDQEFLSKLQVLLNKNASAVKTEEMNTMPSMNASSTTPPSIKTTHKPQAKSNNPAGADSTNLKNFFQNLLNKNAPSNAPGSTSSSPASGDSAATSSSQSGQQASSGINLSTSSNNPSESNI